LLGSKAAGEKSRLPTASPRQSSPPAGACPGPHRAPSPPAVRPSSRAPGRSRRANRHLPGGTPPPAGCRWPAGAPIPAPCAPPLPPAGTNRSPLRAPSPSAAYRAPCPSSKNSGPRPGRLLRARAGRSAASRVPAFPIPASGTRPPLHRPVVRVHVDDAGPVPPRLVLRHDRIRDDDDDVAGVAEPCGGAVEADVALAARARHHIGLKARPVVDVDHLDALIGDDIRELH